MKHQPELTYALQEQLDLATKYNALCAYNFHRTDIVRAFPIVDGQPREMALVRDGEQWLAYAMMPDGTHRTPDRFMGLPVPETQEAYDKVALEQHALHVKLYEATQRVRQLAAAGGSQ